MRQSHLELCLICFGPLECDLSIFHLLLTLTHFHRTFVEYHVCLWYWFTSISFISMEGEGSFCPDETENSSRAEVRRIIHSRQREEGETSLDRIRISNRLHGIGDRVIVQKYNPDIFFVGVYVGDYEHRIIVERKSGCNLIWYRTHRHHLHASNIISNSVHWRIVSGSISSLALI